MKELEDIIIDAFIKEIDDFYGKNVDIGIYEDEQIEHLTVSPWDILIIKNPSHNLIKHAVSMDGALIQFFPDRCEELKMIAVKSNYRAISHIPNPSINVQKAAIENDYRALEIIPNPSESIILFALRINPQAIMFVKNPTLEMRLITS